MPKHIAIIMDGNGRWASRHCSPAASATKPVLRRAEVVEPATELEIGVLTVYAFTTENCAVPRGSQYPDAVIIRLHPE
jgi:undecaprenyl diphosphate synthase